MRQSEIILSIKPDILAKQTSQQLLWIHAEDYLDDPQFAEMTQEEKEKDKRIVYFKVPQATNRLHSNTVALVL